MTGKKDADCAISGLSGEDEGFAEMDLRCLFCGEPARLTGR